MCCLKIWNALEGMYNVNVLVYMGYVVDTIMMSLVYTPKFGWRISKTPTVNKGSRR
jgi:hypothetical protein